MKITVPKILDLKNSRQISMMTAYDFPTANAVSEAGIDIILVGDSLAQVVLGHDDTLSITMDEMLHHVKAVTRAQPDSLVVADMPYMSYHNTVEEAVRNAARFIQEAGADAVKLEGGKEIKDSIKRIIKAGIPVMGHLGLTPQSIYKFGTYTVRAKEEKEANQLISDAKLLEKIGCFAIVLEKIPSDLAKKVAKEVNIPIIGIGAGNKVDGQVLVLHDLIGMTKEFNPRFLRRYMNLHDEMINAISSFSSDIKNGDFPNENEQY